MKIGLISCTSMKQTYPCKASKMYEVSPRFQLSYEYAKKTCEIVYILSAKYGLIHEDTFIEPYNETLSEKTETDRKNWSRCVLHELDKKHSLQNDEYLILAGMKYCEFLIPFLRKHTRPLQGVRLGNWIPTLRMMLNNLDQNNDFSICDHLHKMFNCMKRYTWVDIDKIPFNNGVYIMFEKGEMYSGWDRIVRIGTHTSDDRLKARLKDHFCNENKDGSILRKNIGLALLNKVQDQYLSVWGLDTSKPDVIEKYSNLIDKAVQASIEKQVTIYLRTNISFVCISIGSREDRLRFEEGLISSLSNSKNFQHSEHWLGQNSPKKLIVQSGLWNNSGLAGQPLSKFELMKINEFVNSNQTFAQNQEVALPTEYFSKVLSDNHQKFAQNKSSTHDIKNYVLSKINEARQNHIDHVDLISGKIHRELGLNNCMPSVCSAMRQVMGRDDAILKTTPSGNSSTITIRYITRDQ